MTLGPLQFGFPWALLLLILLVPTFVLGARRLAYTGTIRRRLILFLRIALTTLIVIALADPRWRAPDTAKATVFLIDASKSTSNFQLAASTWVRQALDKMGPEDQSAVVAFSSQPIVLQPMGRTKDFRAAALPSEDRTDLASALKLAQALLPPSGVRRFVILSDGWENVGRSEDLLDTIASAGISVDFVKPTPPAVGVIVKSIDMPPQVRDGDPFDAIVQIESAVATDGTLTLLLDGATAGAQGVKLRAGNNQYAVPVTAAGEGFHRVTGKVQLAGDGGQADGFGDFVVKPRGAVLILEDRTGESKDVAAIVEKAGLRVETRLSTSVPTNATALRAFDAIVLNNVAATAMTLDQQKTLQTYVKVLGKGLVILGGPNSYSLGDYGSSLLNELLPVHADLPPKPEEGTFGLMLIIDKSGSMDLKGDGVSKMQMAKEAALLAVDMLRDDDYIGIVVFDTNNRWLVQPQQVSANRGVPAIQARIVGVAADGGTDIFPALQRGFEGITSVASRYKHVVLLSDGQSPGGDYDKLLRDMRAANVTMSAIAVGSDADTALMSRLAKDGAGRYYFTERVRDIPRIMAKETSIAIGATTVQGHVQPQLVSPSPILRGIVPAELPQLQTYAVTTPKDAAETILMSPSGDPLLASWQYGAGRTVAWTSAVSDDWASDWKSWPDLTKFWGQTLRYAMGSPIEPGLSVSVDTEANVSKVKVDAVTEDGNFIDLANVEATAVSPSGKAIAYPVRQNAPGRYETTIGTEETGAYELRVTLRRGGQPDRSESIGFVSLNDPETRTLAPNDRLLKRFAAATGGHQISLPEQAFADGPKPSGLGWQPLWPWALGLGLILLPFEVAARRLRGLNWPPWKREDL